VLLPRATSAIEEIVDSPGPSNNQRNPFICTFFVGSRSQRNRKLSLAATEASNISCKKMDCELHERKPALQSLPNGRALRTAAS
jgi:hypothetical protein